MLTVTEVAEQLGIHVKTVRRHIAEGRIKAVRIGKHYRIPAAALAALTSVQAAPPPGASLAPRTGAVRRFAEATSVVQIEALARDDAERLMAGIGGALKGRDKHNDGPLRVDTVYDEVRGRLKIIITGSLTTTSILLELITAYAK